MTNKKVRISYGRTVQSAPYESIRLDVAIEKEVLDDTDVTAEVERSVDALAVYVKNKIKRILDSE